MGCCTSRHKNFESEILDSIKIESIHTVPEFFKISIFEIHLTKNLDRVLKSPSNYSLKVFTQKEMRETQPIQFQGLHYNFLSPPEMVFRIPSKTLSISLIGHKYSNFTTVGSVEIDLEIFSIYRYFKGSSHMWYRCNKIGTVLIEIIKTSGDSEYMTMTDQRKCIVGQFLPCREYPEDFISNLNPTPKFNTLTFPLSGEFSRRDTEKIRTLKEKYVNFEFLIECLYEDSAEVLYYAFDKLEFFAYQKNYSEKIPIEVVLEKIDKFGSDQFVINKALWLLFLLIDNCQLALEHFQGLKVMGILHALEQFYSTECSVLGLEIILMYIEGSQQRLTKIVPELKEIIQKLLSDKDSYEVIAACLSLIHKIMSISGKPEYWHMIISNNTLKHINFYITEFILNNEIITNSLKILVSYALSNTFTRNLSSALSPSCLITMYSIYFSDKVKVKSISQIFGKIIPFVHRDDLAKVLRLLIKILKNNMNSNEIMKISIKGLKTALKKRPESIESLLNEKAIDLYIDLFSYFSEELVNNAGFIKFIYGLGLKSEKVKELVWKNESVREVLEGVSFASPASSTGSSLSQNLNMKTSEMVSVILSIE